MLESGAVSTILPAINASLNAATGVLLLIAYVLIRRHHIQMHKRFMLAACPTASIFLVCYVLNHILRHGVVTRFLGTGWARPLSFPVLLLHTILAIAIVPLVILSV